MDQVVCDLNDVTIEPITRFCNDDDLVRDCVNESIFSPTKKKCFVNKVRKWQEKCINLLDDIPAFERVMSDDLNKLQNEVNVGFNNIIHNLLVIGNDRNAAADEKAVKKLHQDLKEVLDTLDAVIDAYKFKMINEIDLFKFVKHLDLLIRLMAVRANPDYRPNVVPEGGSSGGVQPEAA